MTEDAWVVVFMEMDGAPPGPIGALESSAKVVKSSASQTFL